MVAVRSIGQLILAGALLASAPVYAQAPAAMPPVPGAPASMASGPAEEGLRIILDGVELAPITADEIAGGSVLPQSSPKLDVRADGRGLRADAGLRISPGNTVVRRELRGLWQYGRSTDKAAGEPRVRIALEGRGGGDSLVSVEDGVTRLPVRLRPVRAQKQSSANGLDVYEGDLVLEIPVEALHKPGQYRGQIRVSVEEF